MTQENLSMKVRHVSGSASVIDIHGDISGTAKDTLIGAYSEAISQGERNIILNFSDLAYMNSSGIGLLVTLLIRSRRQEQRLIACGLSEHYRQIFELTRLSDSIAIYASEAEALQAVNEIR